MAWVSLKMVSLGSLLILNEQASSSSSSPPPPPSGHRRCMNERELNSRADKYRRSYWDTLSVSADRRTCADTARLARGDLSHRYLSPWTYSLDRDADRFPREIAFARCLCRGCIVGQREDLSYNSVPVFAPLLVLRRTRCPRDPDKYAVRRDFIKVPVACTCVVPKYAE